MAHKTRALSLLAVLFLASACAHKKAAPATGAPLLESPNTGESVPPPAQVQAQEVSGDTGNGASPAAPEASADLAEAGVAVWVDGAGLEALAALGFLQELEKRGVRPVKIVGTGFGCWVATSWALENNGNRAEWQAFKWSRWDSLEGGWLGRLTSSSDGEKFRSEMRRLLPAEKFSDLKLAADCPVLQKAPPHRLISGGFLDIPSLMWLQFQVPALGSRPERENIGWFSGLAGGTPLPEELEVFSQDIKVPAGKRFAGWLILRTRNQEDRACCNAWGSALSARSDAHAQSFGRSPQGVRWVMMDISDGPARPTSEIKNFEQRRRWVLQGRAKADSFLQRDFGAWVDGAR